MKTVLQILTVCGLFLEVLGAFYLAKGNGLWQEVFRLPESQRNSRLGSFMFWLIESKGNQATNLPWWRVDSFRGILCLLVGFICQIPSAVRAIFY
jgi:hypothetical protein